LPLAFVEDWLQPLSSLGYSSDAVDGHRPNE
jgi:hypothetical protein